MGHHDDSAARKVGADSLLHLPVRLRIQVGRRLVTHQKPAAAKQRAPQTNKLTLSDAPVLAALCHFGSASLCTRARRQAQAGDDSLRRSRRRRAKRVKIRGQISGEEHRLLWYQRKGGAQVVQADAGDVDAVDEDAARAARVFHQSEEGRHERGLSCAGAAHNA